MGFFLLLLLVNTSVTCVFFILFALCIQIFIAPRTEICHASIDGSSYHHPQLTQLQVQALSPVICGAFCDLTQDFGSVQSCS